MIAQVTRVKMVADAVKINKATLVNVNLDLLEINVK